MESDKIWFVISEFIIDHIFVLYRLLGIFNVTKYFSGLNGNIVFIIVVIELKVEMVFIKVFLFVGN